MGLQGLALVEVVPLLHSQKVLGVGLSLAWVPAAVTLSLDSHKGRARLPTGLKELTGALTRGPSWHPCPCLGVSGPQFPHPHRTAASFLRARADCSQNLGLEPDAAVEQQGRPGPGPSWLQVLGLPLPNKRPHRQTELAACWSPGRGPWGLGRDQLWEKQPVLTYFWVL